jgi:uncharacterized protein (TIGR02231 family)
MKKIAIFSIIFFAVLLKISAQSIKDISSEMSHITVFPDRAQINHEASVALTPGKTTLRISGLSPYIDAQSIQVKGYGDFTILAVNHQNNFLQNLEDNPEIKNIKIQIGALQIKVEDEKAAIAVLKEKQEFLVANRAILVKETTFTVEQFKNVMDLYTNNMEQVTVSTLKKNRQIKEYETQIIALQQQIAEKTGKQQLPSGEILVTVSSEKQLTGKITFSYVTSNAGWYPSYDIRVDDIKNPVTIFYKANVFQNSGVDWKDVKLSFSNATPWVAGDIPVLNPWFINYYNPIPVAKGVKGAMMLNDAPVMMEMSADKARKEEAIEAAPVLVEKQVGETSVTFDVSIPYSISADGKTQTIEIQRITSQSDYKYVSSPKISQLAYLSANITDWSKLNLQNGEATLYFENSFVGKSYLNVNQLNDTLTISLGTDNSILVKREKRKEFTSKKTIGTNKTETYSYLITIRNNKSNGIKITLNDQIPVSSNSGITVQAEELSGGKLNEQTGEIKWNMELKPQETKQVILTYSVKYPKDKIIILE